MSPKYMHINPFKPLVELENPYLFHEFRSNYPLKDKSYSSLNFLFTKISQKSPALSPSEHAFKE
jgi:hypothetical protein